MIRPLTEPVSAGDAFHVVVPSLPGFGFSERPRERGRNPGRTAPSADEQRMLDRRFLHLADGYAFGMLMGTRPQTLGYSLLASPAGLGEKFAAYADDRPEAGGEVSVADQVDNIALYWLTGTGASSARWY
ncbi:hypothetical protein ACFWIW_36295 [Amycolatopsis sp. NPDC058340]|uniref:hypothetical protein n=1 Tax=Amycolatopsis sp. NPDC058340 TaxID=3346453 RepID=UPI003659A8C7